MILSRNHGQMIDSWYCETSIPKHSDTNDLSDYCITMQEHVYRDNSCKRDHKYIEQSRMYFTNLDYPSFKEIKNSLLQEVRDLRIVDTDLKPNLRLLMLLGTMENHHLHAKPITSNNINLSSKVDEI